MSSVEDINSLEVTLEEGETSEIVDVETSYADILRVYIDSGNKSEVNQHSFTIYRWSKRFGDWMYFTEENKKKENAYVFESVPWRMGLEVTNEDIDDFEYRIEMVSDTINKNMVENRIDGFKSFIRDMQGGEYI